MSEEKVVLAVVEGKEITNKDVENLMMGLGQRAMQFNSEQGKKQLLDELINQQLFFVEAVNQKMDERDDFKREMEIAKENILKQLIMRDMLSKIEIKDEEVKEYYEKHKDMFGQPETVQASHILVDTEEKAQEVMKEIEGGLDFAEAASKYSSCPSKERGGDLGPFGKGQMVPEFDQAVFEMNVEETRGPVETQFGFHIIKVTDKKEASVQPFEHAAPQVRQQLTAVKQNETYLNSTNDLRKKYSVEYK